MVALSIPSTEHLQLLQLVYAVREKTGRDEEKHHRRRDEQLLQAGLLTHSEDEVAHGKPNDDAQQSRDRDGLCLRETKQTTTTVQPARQRVRRVTFVSAQKIPQTIEYCILELQVSTLYYMIYATVLISYTRVLTQFCRVTFASAQ